MKRKLILSLVSLSLFASVFSLDVTLFAGVSQYAGLWVGSAKLNYVNEVISSLDENNDPISVLRWKTTPTADQCEIMLIIHVNAAGQASFLKDVVVLDRNAVQDTIFERAEDARESRLALVTNPELYAIYPAQPGTRYTAVAFDFGDPKASNVLNAIRDAIVEKAVDGVSVANIVKDLKIMIGAADVQGAFDLFLKDELSAEMVKAIAQNPQGSAVGSLRSKAVVLRDASVYGDTRAVDMIDAIVTAMKTLPMDATIATKHALAFNIAAAYADTTHSVIRFINGHEFCNMVVWMAQYLATGKSDHESEVNDIYKKGLGYQTNNNTYSDKRFSVVYDAMQVAMVAKVAELESKDVNAIIDATVIEAAGREAILNACIVYPEPTTTPTGTYSEFVRSSFFTGCVEAATSVAKRAVADDKTTSTLSSPASQKIAAELAATLALSKLYTTAASAPLHALPMTGTFAMGVGDTTLSYMLEEDEVNFKDPYSLTCQIFLPASYPTNPFRHRRHPDHSIGYDITRNIRLDFYGKKDEVISTPEHGVSIMAGVYREELFGLHKPLGTLENPIGLRTEGFFQLNRVSSLNTLNAE